MSDFARRAELLGEMWMCYRDDEVFAEFLDYNDIGVPLAYAVSSGLALVSDEGRRMIDESYEMLLTVLGAPDADYEDFDALVAAATRPAGAPDDGVDEAD